MKELINNPLLEGTFERMAKSMGINIESFRIVGLGTVTEGEVVVEIDGWQYSLHPYDTRTPHGCQGLAFRVLSRFAQGVPDDD